MRRCLSLVVLVGALLGLAANPTAAQVVEHLSISGTVTASNGVLGQGGCAAELDTRHQFDVVAALDPLGAATMRIDYCYSDASPLPIVGHGSWTMTTADGTLGGSLESIFRSAGLPQPVQFDLTVTEGTERFDGASGSFVIFAIFTSAQAGTGTVTGELHPVVPPSTPASKDDCKRGGWRTFENDDGEPFPSQGACVRGVTRR